jgi:hypothetical protein
MTVKMIVQEYLTKNGYDGLYNLDAPCGCLLGDLAPCGDILGACQAGYREEVGEQVLCGCEAEGTVHWHVCNRRPVAQSSLSCVETVPMDTDIATRIRDLVQRVAEEQAAMRAKNEKLARDIADLVRDIDRWAGQRAG